MEARRRANNQAMAGQTRYSRGKESERIDPVDIGRDRKSARHHDNPDVQRL
jgi:hypothetical protein